MTQRGLFAPLLPHLLGGHTEDGLARLNVLVDSGSGQHDRTRANDQVLVDAHTAPEDNVVLNARHSCDSGMGTNEAVVADIAVMAYLAVVIQLSAAFDDGVGGRNSWNTVQVR